MIAPNNDARDALRQRPHSKPIMYQRWQDLLFLHWVVEPELIQSQLPKGLHVDCFESMAYLGVVPFFMRNIHFRGTPALPWISNFLELNLRTYVYDDAGRPGVWFFSLDCNQPLGVWAARKLFHLPYEHASMQATRDSTEKIDYRSVRIGQTVSASRFGYTLHRTARQAQIGSLEFFLAERYLLFAATRSGKLLQGQVHHSPYPLSDVNMDYAETDLLRLNGMPDIQRPFDHAIGSRGVDVEVFSLTSVEVKA